VIHCKKGLQSLFHLDNGSRDWLGHDLLKAAGTPMIRDLPFLISSLRLILFPGEDSTKPSTVGMESPTLMKARVELWNDRDGVTEALKASLRRILLYAILVSSKHNRNSYLRW
jgi:hypothetical protein